jgi:transposase
MARRTSGVIDICEIFVHWHAGRPESELAGSLGLSRNTVRKYVAAAEAAGMVPGGPPVSQEEWALRAREWFPELADSRLRQVTWPAIGEHRDYIAGQLEAGVTVATIHQRLADERGLAVSVASLRRYVAANLPEEVRRSQVTVLRLEPAEPGQEAQIDYGQMGRWTDPRTGRRHTVNVFAMVLCCSRLLFVRPVIKMDQRAWTECHVAAFSQALPRIRSLGDRIVLEPLSEAALPFGLLQAPRCSRLDSLCMVKTLLDVLQLSAQIAQLSHRAGLPIKFVGLPRRQHFAQMVSFDRERGHCLRQPVQHLSQASSQGLMPADGDLDAVCHPSRADDLPQRRDPLARPGHYDDTLIVCGYPLATAD